MEFCVLKGKPLAEISNCYNLLTLAYMDVFGIQPNLIQEPTVRSKPQKWLINSSLFAKN